MDKPKKDVAGYISSFPEETQVILQKVRLAIQKAAPEATEVIKYAMPTFVQKGNLVHFAAYKNHIGFYPGPSGIHTFQKELSSYKGGKGSIQFPLGQPIPLKLITEIVQFRVQENRNKASLKRPVTKKNIN